MEISSHLHFSECTPPEKNTDNLQPFAKFNLEMARLRPVTAIVAMARHGAIGRGGTLPWRLSEDMAHFKTFTMGHPVIMGRKTWESIPKRPLPGRRNIVISRSPLYKAEGAEVFPSVEAAIAACAPAEIPVIMGGAQIYAAAFPFCSKIVVTEIDTEVPDADTFFPEIDPAEWNRKEDSELLTSKTGLNYRFVIYTKNENL